MPASRQLKLPKDQTNFGTTCGTGFRCGTNGREKRRARRARRKMPARRQDRYGICPCCSQGSLHVQHRWCKTCMCQTTLVPLCWYARVYESVVVSIAVAIARCLSPPAWSDTCNSCTNQVGHVGTLVRNTGRCRNGLASA